MSADRGDGPWLLDNSAWARRFSLGADEAAATALASDLEAERLLACLPFMLEAGYSARDASGHRATIDLLSSLPSLDLDERSQERSLDAQSQLARTGHHRMPPVDLLIAAIADVHEVGVLHYDSHYDVILEETGLDFDSRWLAPRGSI